MNVLIVDDVEFFRERTQKAVSEMSGARVSTTGSIWDAIHSIEKGQVDVMILDVELAKFRGQTGELQTGIDLIRHLRENEIESPHIILLSGSVNPAVVRQAYALGVTKILKKPVKPDVLIKNIREVTSQEKLAIG